MATKYGLAEQVLRILHGGDVSKDADLEIREVMLAVSQARDFIVKRDLYAQMAVGEYDISGQYISEFDDVPLADDEKYGLVYAELPAKYIDLPRDLGIYEVHLCCDPYNSFVPLRPGHHSLYNGLDSQQLSNRIGYMPRDNKIYFYNLDCDTAVEKVCISMIASGADLSDDCDFPVGPDKEMEVLQMAAQLLQGHVATPNDNINDNVK